MMHAADDVVYGRIGTLDPGDLVVIRAVDDDSDVVTLLEGGRTRYGAVGDVVLYRPAGDETETPIIHRAIAYVDVAESRGATTYRVKWDPATPCAGGARRDGAWCVFDSRGILLPEHGIVDPGERPYKPTRDGFITKGDNPLTNRLADPMAGISTDDNGRPSVVPLEWVEGVSRGELPWLGLLKLAVQGQPNEAQPPPSYVRVGSAYAPADLWVMLVVSLAAVLLAPMVIDRIVEIRRAQ